MAGLGGSKVTLVLPALLLVAALAPGSGAQGTGVRSGGNDEGGALYLTTASLGADGDETCPESYRYDMTTDREELVDGEAPFSPRNLGALTCPTRFVYTVATPVTLGAAANVTMTMRCEPASATSPTAPAELELLLSPNPHEPYPANRSLASAPGAGAPVTCDGAPFTIERTIPAFNLTLAPTDTLALHVWLRFANPDGQTAPLVHFMTGGDEPSRIEASGLPSPAAERGAVPVDTRQRLYWSAQPVDPGYGSTTGVRPVPCVDPPEFTYAMVDDPAAVEPGTVTSQVGAPVASCPVEFIHEATRNTTLHGRVTVELWFTCDNPSPGNDRVFGIAFRKNAEPHGDPAQSSYATTTDVCEGTPVPVTFDAWMDPPMTLGPGDVFSVRVRAHYVTDPYVTSNMRYVIDAEHPSGLLIAGVGDADAQAASPPGPAGAGAGARPQSEPASDVPAPGLLVILFSAAVAAGVLRWRRGA